MSDLLDALLAWLGGVADWLLDLGHAWLVGLEMPRMSQDEFDAYVADVASQILP